MRTQKKASSRRRRTAPKDFISNSAALQFSYGCVLDDGSVVDLVVAAGQDPQLYVFDGEREQIVPQLKAGRLLLRPGTIPAALREIVRFPERAAASGSPEKLFADLRGCFEHCGFPEDAAVRLALFAIASCFAEVLPAAPTLVITGSAPEAAFALELLSCAARRGLRVAEFTRSTLCSLPLEIRPTLLINAGELGNSSRKLCHVTSRAAVFPHNGGFLNLCCSKAIYAGPVAGSLVSDPALCVRLTPFLGPIPILGETRATEIAREFQPRMLNYRARNFLAAKSSQFDIAELSSSTRILARIFGAPLAGAATLEALLKTILQDEDQVAVEEKWTDFDFVVLEAVIHHLHTKPGTKVFVGEISDFANSILELRGDTRKRQARAVGPALRRFGIGTLPREKYGFPLDLSPTVADRAHRLAQESGLLHRTPNGKCKICAEMEEKEVTGNEDNG